MKNFYQHRKTFKSFQPPDPMMEVSGFLGDMTGLVKADDNFNVYVTLSNRTVVTMRNSRVPNVPHLPVVVGYTVDKPKLLQILRIRDVYNNLPYPEMQMHGQTHTWASLDTVWVRGEQIIPGLVIPKDTLPYTLQFFGFVYYLSGWKQIADQSINFSARVPTSGAKMLLVEIDTSGVISFNAGTSVANRTALTVGDIPAPTVNKKPLFAMKVYAGQSTALKNESYSDIIDLRWSGYSSSGGGTPAGSSTQIQYNSSGAFSASADFVYDNTTKTINLGGTTPFDGTVTNALLVTKDNGAPSVGGFAYGNSVSEVGGMFFNGGLRADGSKATPTGVKSGMGLYRASGRGYDGSGWGNTQGQMLIRAGSDWGTTNHETRMEFYITPSGTTSEVLGLILGSNGILYNGAGVAYQAINTTIPNDGWIAITATPTSGTLDAPSFEISFNADMTAIIGLGDRIKATQSTQKYFIVTKVGAFASGATIITCYGGTDYTLVASSTTAITLPFVSHIKSPFGFPTSPAKWTVSATNTSDATKATPTANIWYGGTGLTPTGISISAPIGVWNVIAKALIQIVTPATAGGYGIRFTLSTANNSESDASWTNQFVWAQTAVVSTQRAAAMFPYKLLTLTTKTTYYLNILTGQASVTSIAMFGSIATTTIDLVCAYL